MTIPEVAHTAEFQRVASLPRRAWAIEDLALLSDELTSLLKAPGGTQRLRPVQALALRDIGVERGLFGPIGVGDGKTLVTLLAPAVVPCERPMLLTPGGLIEKTQRDRLALSRNWRIPTSLRLFSYDLLGRVNAADELNNFRPDLIICDEVHRLKNKRAAVTRRVARYMHDFPETMFVGLSGSIMDKSLTEFAHIMCWALKLGAPIPTAPEEIEEWAEALDHGVDPMARRRAGALLEFAEPSNEPEHVRARKGFCRRMVETPGVVATIGSGEHVDCSIYLKGIMHPVAGATEAAFRKLREEWRTPDDWELMYAIEVHQHAQELQLGLYYTWNPRPPIDWYNARQAWHRFVRQTIARSRTYDSELHVANACDAGKLPSEELTRWREVRDTFVPNIVPVWCDDSALQVCKDWAHKPGIIWTEHRFFAERLSQFANLEYYGAGGFSAAGRYIEDEKSTHCIIASIDANREGKNLQKLWSRNLIASPPGNATWWEQTIARTHRTGQEADEVIVDVLLGCRENFDAVSGALEKAAAIQDTTGKKQKLLLADRLLPTEAEINALHTPRWVR
jgi:hypothetical protein